MKLASLLGLLTTGGVIAAGEITYHTLSNKPNKTEETPVSEPELSPTTQLTQNTVSSNEPKEIIPSAIPQPSSVSQQSTPRKKKDLNEKEKLIERIKDYTVKVVCVSSSSSFGTG